MTDDPDTTPDQPQDGSPSSTGSPIDPGRGTGEPATDDPYAEGGAATTQEWFGQSVERDTELAERMVDEHDGDLEAAEAAYDAQATGAQEQEARRHGPPPSGAPDARP